MHRTLQSPATDKQMAFVAALLMERDVPKKLRKKIKKRDKVGLTDGDCRKFIPKLQSCERVNRTSSSAERWNNEDYGNYDEWRDHPDAVFGRPDWMGA